MMAGRQHVGGGKDARTAAIWLAMIVVASCLTRASPGVAQAAGDSSFEGTTWESALPWSGAMPFVVSPLGTHAPQLKAARLSEAQRRGVKIGVAAGALVGIAVGYALARRNERCFGCELRPVFYVLGGFLIGGVSGGGVGLAIGTVVDHGHERAGLRLRLSIPAGV